MADYIRKLELLWGIPIFMQREGEKPESFGSFLTEGNPLECCAELTLLLKQKSMGQELPVVYRDENEVYFVCIRDKDIYYYTGPVSIEEPDYSRLHRFYKTYGILKEFRRPPFIMKLDRVLNFSGLLYELLTGRTADPPEILIANGFMKEKQEVTEKEKTLQEMRRAEEGNYHHTYREERFMTDSIREGNVEDVEKRLEALSATAGVLSGKQFNHQRNLAISSVTICTRAAIEGGVSPAKAYRISDLFINKIDQSSTVEEVVGYNRKAAVEFASAVRENRSRKGSSSYTEQCRDYILNNYHHKIRLDEVARVIGISQGHLSRVFYADTGMTIQEYIQRFRVERAENLLKYSEAELSQISDYAGFYSQSHFGSVFKRYTGMTPKSYRDKYKEKEFRSEKK